MKGNLRLVLFGLLGACGGAPGAADATMPQLPAWSKTLPDASVMGARRGLVPARGIVHLHSPYSHDACDNMPRDPVTGAVDEPCLDDLRAAVCADHIDFAALTDHDDTMADEDFPTLFSMRGSDVAITDGSGAQTGSRQTCADGHQVLWSVGSENTLMPIMLDRHVAAPDLQARHDLYNADTADAMAAYRTAGGLAWIAHTEEHAIDELRAVAPDGVELYNLHANIDPKIRGPYLGLDPSGAIDAAVDFVPTEPGGPEPDLALLSFLSVNQPAIDRWALLLGDGKHVPGTAGSDAHENALPILLSDGERGDSYRRVLRWFSNEVLVADPKDPQQIKAALAGGRVFATFEIMGTPAGFDARAVTAAGATVELGGQVATSDGASLVVDVPTVLGLDTSLPAPDIRAKVIYIAPGGAQTTVADGAGPQLTAPLAATGAYRVEVSIVPHHLGPYLGSLGTGYADQELPWIYASPIYVN
jgi:hypothetical protein|nr:hypothetical protein [Kofleriaceae bacterium]